MRSAPSRSPLRTVGTWLLRLGASLTALTLSVLVVLLLLPTVRFFSTGGVSLPGFLFGTAWSPEAGLYGARPFFAATLRTALLAVLFATPGSLVLGIYMSDYAPEPARRRYILILDILASIPAVVYGLFALMFVTPLMQVLGGVDRVRPFNTLSAALVLGLYITPYVTSLLTGPLSHPRGGIRNAAMALGATRAETLIRIVLPDAVPGILSAMVLGFSRALAESIIVGMAAGLGPAPGFRLLTSAETVTGYILRAGSGGADVIYAFGLILFVLTLGLNLFGDWLAGHPAAEERR